MSKAAPLRVERSPQGRFGFLHRRIVEIDRRGRRFRLARRRRRSRANPPQFIGDLMGLRDHGGTTALPSVGHGHQHLIEAGQAVVRPRRPVSAAEKRLAFRREKHRQRPAAAAGQHLHRVHIDLIQIETLLPIDLDAYETLVQQPGDFGIFKSIMGHHVAPMTGGITDRQEDWLLLGPGQGQRLGIPGPPIHRVSGVLEEVRAQFVGKVVRTWRHQVPKVVHNSRKGGSLSDSMRRVVGGIAKTSPVSVDFLRTSHNNPLPA